MTARKTPADMTVSTGPQPGGKPAVEQLTPADIGRLQVIPESIEVTTVDVEEQLKALRRPFPPEMIEKLPKPMWKGAWDNGKGATCPECHGYHVLSSAIHLDYVGHANVTNRLLEVDPFWDWQPLAWTEAGTPLFTDKGMWIKLTVCGVTRLGYGDGASVKEIIGDAIRNAAMRFGVGLDLWSKIDLHAERNPGDGQTPQRQQSVDRGSRSRPAEERPVATDPPRAANQDALDALGSICDQHGYPRTEMRTLYILWAADNERPDTDLLEAAARDILDFGAKLVRDATAEPQDGPGDREAPRDSDGQGQVRDNPGAVHSGDAEGGEAAGSGGGNPDDGAAVDGAGPAGDEPASPEEMF